jgi:hypothetical protein
MMKSYIPDIEGNFLAVMVPLMMIMMRLRMRMFKLMTRALRLMMRMQNHDPLLLWINRTRTSV